MLRTELFNVDTILERLLPWVREESPTNHVAGVNRMMDLVGADLAAIGGDDRAHRPAPAAAATSCSRASPDATAPTVPAFSFSRTSTRSIRSARSPDGCALRRDGDRYFGPGIYDMKGGVAHRGARR